MVGPICHHDRGTMGIDVSETVLEDGGIDGRGGKAGRGGRGDVVRHTQYCISIY